MSYKVKLRDNAKDFFNKLSEKDKRIVRRNLDILKDYPYPHQHGGDKEKIRKKLYRIHISRKYTGFYEINDGENFVEVTILTTTEKAHKIYGRL
jgi:mRNA-degrading endonuclease RelE of RelBE toxin-antitoxin system